jgi:hypothetical protein
MDSSTSMAADEMLGTDESAGAGATKGAVLERMVTPLGSVMVAVLVVMISSPLVLFVALVNRLTRYVTSPHV